MVEDIGDVIGKGFAVWRNNLNLCIPFLLQLRSFFADHDTLFCSLFGRHRAS